MYTGNNLGGLPAVAVDDDCDLCFMCDNRVDVKFSPCGHATICSQCAPTCRAKRCPVCKVSRFKTILIANVQLWVFILCMCTLDVFLW